MNEVGNNLLAGPYPVAKSKGGFYSMMALFLVRCTGSLIELSQDLMHQLQLRWSRGLRMGWFFSCWIPAANDGSSIMSICAAMHALEGIYICNLTTPSKPNLTWDMALHCLLAFGAVIPSIECRQNMSMLVKACDCQDSTLFPDVYTSVRSILQTLSLPRLWWNWCT